MNNTDEIRKFAHQRLTETQILFETENVSCGFYLAGYIVDMALK
jgi:hypothetical protein